MDHIPTPINPFEYPVVVPYLAQNRADLMYDGLPLEDFPRRKGFDPEAFCQGIFEPWTSKEAVALFQSWCFFGLLIRVFEIIGIKVQISDFVSKSGTIVTTAILPALSVEWESQERNILASQVHFTKHQELLKELDVVQRFVNRIRRYSEFIDIENGPDSRGQFFFQGIPNQCVCKLKTDVCKDCATSEIDLIFLSVLLLGEHFQRAFALFGEEVITSWHGSNYVKRRFLRAGWCVQEIAHLHDSHVSTTALFYLSMQERHSLGMSHSNCSPHSCLREQLDNKKYETKHTLDCTNCRHKDLNTFWSRQISRHVRKGLVPVLTVTHDSSRKGANVDIQPSYKQGGNSLAIKDGTLTYVCISHVWSDGLGNIKRNSLPRCQLVRLQKLVNDLYPNRGAQVPFWIDTVCVPRKYPERKIAIAAMKEIYQKADKVLVLDAVLSKATSNSSAIEMVMRLRSSTWVKRLWTYHETGLAKSLHYQFGESSRTARSLMIQYREEVAKDRRMKPFGANKATSKEVEPQNDLISKRLNSLDLIYHEGFAFLGELESFKNYYSRRVGEQDYDKFRDITLPLIWRSTSRPQDEPICLANLLDRNVEDLLDRNISAVQRMQKFLQTLESVPDDILFVRRPRIQETNCRWMPESFLGGGEGASLHSRVKATPRPRGLAVKFPGIFISFQERVFEIVIQGNQNMIFIENRGSIFSISNTSDSRFVWNDYAGKKVAVVLQHPLDSDDLFQGILVTLSESTDVQYCRFEHSVIIAGDETDQTVFDAFEAQTSYAEYVVSFDWCVG